MRSINFEIRLAFLRLHSDPKFIALMTKFVGEKMVVSEFDRKLDRAVLINSKNKKVDSL